MNGIIYIKHLWKVENLIRGYKYHKKASTYNFIFSLIRISIAILIILDSIAEILSKSFDLPALYWLFCGVFLLSLNQINYFSIRYKYKNLNYENKTTEWEISKDKIIYRIINLSESIYNWEIFKGILDTSEGFLLYTSKHHFFWLPKSGFKNEEDIAHFAFIAQDKVKNWQQIK